jgi:hypothetical protein
MDKLLKLVDQLTLQLPNADRMNNDVSNASVGWHIEHSCLVIIKIAETIANSDSNNYAAKFNFTKIMVFLTGKFPRGRAKAPQVVMPIENITKSHLEQSILKAKTAIMDLNNCEKNKHFLHPIFGSLNAPETIKFLGIHTNHHLLIIRDILK